MIFFQIDLYDPNLKKLGVVRSKLLSVTMSVYEVFEVY